MNPFTWLDPERCRLLMGALCHFLWQGAILAGACMALLAMLRKASAHVRYAVALGGLVFMAACPPITAWALRTRAADDPVTLARPTVRPAPRVASEPLKADGLSVEPGGDAPTPAPPSAAKSDDSAAAAEPVSESPAVIAVEQ